MNNSILVKACPGRKAFLENRNRSAHCPLLAIALSIDTCTGSSPAVADLL